MNNLKRNMLSLALTGSFIVGLGALSDAAAQGRQRRNMPSQRGGGQIESTGNIDQNKNGIDDRFESRDGRVDMNQNGVADDNEYGRNGRNRGYGNQGNYGNRGNYGNGNYGYNNNNADFQRGYRDGLDRGQEDARSRRAMTPNNSSHYRSGSASYRAGFERGFNESYRRFGNRGW